MIRGRSTRKTVQERHAIHPLQLNDPEALKYIKLVRWDFILKEINYPVPRRQDIPPRAFGEINGKCIVLCTSHAWYYQCHPDPEGTKLQIMRSHFGPLLQERYPDTEILLFDDWLCCPQKPRTAIETEIFSKGMHHMNSMYLYCDAVLFLEAPLPKPPSTLLMTTTLVPSKYKWKWFVDCMEFDEEAETDDWSDSENAEDDRTRAQIRRFDAVAEADGVPITRESDMNSFVKRDTPTEIRFMRRAFGRFNPVPPNDRGWLFLERVTIAIKAAASGPECFNSIALSNSKALCDQIFNWSRMMRAAAKKKKSDDTAMTKCLQYFQDKLKQKRFTYESDGDMVHTLMQNLVTKFVDNWDQEVVKQKKITKRARELFLSWGRFSRGYVKRLGLTEDFSQKKSVCGLVFMGIVLSVIPPIIASIPFMLPIAGPRNDDDGIVEAEKTSRVAETFMIGIVLTCLNNIVMDFISKIFTKIPFGRHNILRFLIAAPCFICLRAAFSSFMNPAFPMEFVLYFPIMLPFFQFAFGIKFIPIKSKSQGDDGSVSTTTKLWNLGTWLYFPGNRGFDPEVRFILKNALREIYIIYGMVIIYPIVGGVVLQFDTLVQALLLPLFVGFRYFVESVFDMTAGKHFGADIMPQLSWYSVMFHEVCLSIIICESKSFLIVFILILSDVIENVLCIVSLGRVAIRRLKRSRAVVPSNLPPGVAGSPSAVTNKIPRDAGSPSSVTTQKIPRDLPSTMTPTRHVPSKIPLTSRSSVGVMALIDDLEQTDSVETRDRTALLILTTLLQRELAETLVPMQAMIVMSLLYYKGGDKTNALVSEWDDDDYTLAMEFLLMDIFIEMCLLSTTLLVLAVIYPSLSAVNTLYKTVRSQLFHYCVVSILVWMLNLYFQSTFSGMDLSLEFDWVSSCSDRPGYRWDSGFRWLWGVGNETIDC